MERIESFGVVKKSRRMPAARDSQGRSSRFPGERPTKTPPEHMDAIEEALDDNEPPEQRWKSTSLGSSGSLPQVPGATDFSMLKQTVSRHLSERVQPEHAVENETFITELEASIAHELTILGCPSSGPSMPRLQVFKQSFDILIKHFKAYRPMLSMIKQEYDKHLEHLVSQCDSLRHLEDNIGLSKYKRQQDVVVSLRNFKETKESLQNELTCKQEQISVKKESLRELRAEVAKYRGIQNTVAKALDDGQCSNKNLRSRVEHLVDTIGEAKREEDPEMRKAYNKSKREYDKLYKEMADLRHQLLHVLIPPKELTEAQKRFETLKKQEAEARTSKIALAEQLHELACQERSLDQKKAALEEELRTSTPRPDWTKPEKILNLQGTTFSEGATTTLLRVDDLVSKIQQMQTKKTEYVERLAKWEEEQARAGNKPSDKQKQQNRKYITTLGTGDKVPKYLSFEGKVRRREIPKRDTEQLINDIWAQKALHDDSLANQGSKRSSLKDFLHAYLTKRFGLQAMVAEWGYNLLEALNKYKYDADCEVFLLVLRNKLSEDFLHNQESLISAFTSGLEKKYPTGSVPEKKKLVDYIKDFFDSKAEDRMEEVLEALDEQFPEPGSIPFEELWAENKNGDQGPFAETVRDHDLAERQEYLEDIEEAFKLGLHAAGPTCNGSLSYKAVREILLKMDPGLNDTDGGPQHHKFKTGTDQMSKMMFAGFQLSPQATDWETTMILAETFVKRLLKLPLRRFTRTNPAADPDRAVELEWSKKGTGLEDDMDDIEADEEELPEEPLVLPKFSGDECGQLSRHFKAITNDSGGIMSIADFTSAIINIIRCEKLFAMRFAKMFDFDGNDQIDFKEFEAAMWMLTKGSAEDRMKAMFDVYDTNNDGTVSKEDMLLYFYVANQMANPSKKRTRETLKKEVSEAFALIDTDHSETITVEECLAALKKCDFLGRMFDAL